MGVRVFLMVATVFACAGALAGGWVRAEEQALPGEAASASPAETAKKPWACDGDLTYNSKYVWRGIKVTEDPVLEPSITFGCGDLSLNVWANLDTTAVNDYEWQANEIDYTLDYSTTWKNLNLSLGGIFYQFPGAEDVDTVEAYGAVGLDIPTAPKLTVYQDLDEHDGTYMVLSFGHTFEDVWKPSESVRMGVDLSTRFAYGTRKHNLFYYGSDASGWADARVSLGLPFAIGDHVTVTPAIHHLWILSDGLSRALGEDSVFWAGVSVAVAF
jgi:hypothetical protein